MFRVMAVSPGRLQSSGDWQRLSRIAKRPIVWSPVLSYPPFATSVQSHDIFYRTSGDFLYTPARVERARETLTTRGTAPVQPKSGLSGPPARESFTDGIPVLEGRLNRHRELSVVPTARDQFRNPIPPVELAGYSHSSLRDGERENVPSAPDCSRLQNVPGKSFTLPREWSERGETPTTRGTAPLKPKSGLSGATRPPLDGKPGRNPTFETGNHTIGPYGVACRLLVCAWGWSNGRYRSTQGHAEKLAAPC